MLGFGGPYPGSQPAAPDFADGWYGYVSKDLRDVLAANGQGSPPKGAYKQLYCGNGSLEACRQALQNSLLEALSVTPQQIYGQGACAENAQASCFDMNRWTSASAISGPAVPVPEPADVPAGRRTHYDASALALSCTAEQPRGDALDRLLAVGHRRIVRGEDRQREGDPRALQAAHLVDQALRLPAASRP